MDKAHGAAEKQRRPNNASRNGLNFLKEFIFSVSCVRGGDGYGEKSAATWNSKEVRMGHWKTEWQGCATVSFCFATDSGRATVKKITVLKSVSAKVAESSRK